MAVPSPSPHSHHSHGSHRAVRAFRGDDGRATLRLHPLEKSLLVVAGAQLVFMPWALGTMHVWSQWTALGLAALAFLLALWPRHYTEEYAREGEFKLLMWPKLVRSPLFWLGLLLLAYIATQALNPSWAHTPFGNSAWTLLPVEHIAWLPSGIEAPFAQMNAWRMLVIYGAVWLLACALWVGLTRRGAVHTLLAIVVVNGALLTLLGLLQSLAGNGRIFWLLESSNPQFFASFIYRNHGGAYLNLVAAISLGLCCWQWQRGRRHFAKSNPGVVYGFVTTLIVLGIIVSASRGAIVTMLALAAVALVVVTVTLIRSDVSQRPWGTFVGLLLLFGIFAGMGWQTLGTERAVDRMQRLWEGGDSNWESRQIATQAATDMLEARWVQGWGAGGFRWMFPAYQQHYPEIYRSPGPRPVMMFWEYAHNDWVQIPVELGALGSGLLALLALALLVTALKNGGWRSPLGLTLLLGVGLSLVHARGEFIFYNPAVLTLWAACFVLAAKWPSVERRR